MSSLISQLFRFIIQLFAILIDIVLTPIDLLLVSVVPNFEVMGSYVNDFLGYFFNAFVFVLEWIHIPYEAVLLIGGYITFRVTMFIAVLTYRIFIRWVSILFKGMSI